MRKLYLILRAGLIWAVSLPHFALGSLFLLLLAVFVDPRKSDFLQRAFARNILRLAGVGFEVRYAPGFDRQRTSIFVSNHVNIFDPFVIYSSIPQFVRGWELESHFRIPIYGWLMKRFGNIPVPDQRKPGGLRRLIHATRKALDSGTSLVVFAEGGRTTDGRVKQFQKGIFRMVRDLEYPIVPMSIVGSFEFNRKGSYMLAPSKIVVYLHDTIETKGMSDDEREALCERVQRIVSAPVDASLGIPADTSAAQPNGAALST